MDMACGERRDDDCASRAQNILSQDPFNYDALVIDARLNLEKGDAAKAARQLEYLSNTYTRNLQVRYQLALAYLRLAEGAGLINARNALDNAERRLTEAVKLDPQFEPAVLSFADLEIRRGRPQPRSTP